MNVIRAICVLALALPVATPARAGVDLMEVFRLALSSDPLFLRAGAANRAAQEQRAQARAALLPNVKAGANIAGNEFEVRETSVGMRSRPSFDSKEFLLSITQPIYRKDLWIGLDQADISIRQANVVYASARQSLMLRVAQAYFAVLQAIDELSFARATLEAFGQQLKQSEQRFEVGLIAITDVEEAKAGFDRATADVIGAENAVDTAGEALREVTGEYHPNLVPLSDVVPLVVPEPADIDQWTETAHRQNLDLNASKFGADLAREEIKRQRAQHLPTVDLFGNYSANESGGVTGDTETRLASIGLQIQVPIYQGGATLSTTRESQHLYQRSLDEVERARRGAQRQTRDAFLGVESGISRVQALEQAVRSAQSAKDAIEAGFQVGTRTSVDVLNADRDVFRARRDHAVARYSYILDILRLKRAAGTLSEEDLSTLNSWLR